MENKTTETKAIELKANQQALKVAGKVITVSKVNHEGENVQGSFEFRPHEKVLVKCIKIADSTKVACEVLIGTKAVASGLSAQGMMTVVEALTGVKSDRVNAMYKKANPFRKEGKGGKAIQIVDTSKLEDVKL